MSVSAYAANGGVSKNNPAIYLQFCGLLRTFHVQYLQMNFNERCR